MLQIPIDMQYAQKTMDAIAHKNLCSFVLKNQELKYLVFYNITRYLLRIGEG